MLKYLIILSVLLAFLTCCKQRQIQNTPTFQVESQDSTIFLKKETLKNPHTHIKKYENFYSSKESDDF